MKDLEDIIKDKRQSLDIEEVPTESWGMIMKEWKRVKPQRDFNMLWKVAAILFFLSTAALIVFSLSQNTTSNVQLASLGDISSEYKKIEQSYMNEINAMQASIQQVKPNEAGDINWLFQELEELDKINEIYRQDIGKMVDQERLVNALVDYYEKKIRILRKIQLEIKRQENEKDSSEYGV